MGKIIEPVSVRIVGDRWMWRFKYDDGRPQSIVHGIQEYGDTHEYKGETEEELLERGRKSAEKVISKIEKLYANHQ